MGCLGSSTKEIKEQKDINRAIEEKLKVWNKDFQKSIKILLLGTGESGKTTILKQMTLLHIREFSDSDRQEKVVEIRQNIHESIYDLITNMSLLRPPLQLTNEDSEASATYIQNIGPQEPSDYSQEYFDHVATLWKDRGVQQCYQRSNEFQLIEGAKYFLDRVEDVRNPTYRPTDQDILFSRKRTTGIQKIEFDMDTPKRYGGGKVRFWMYDVGGQRGERKKWLPVFDIVNAILFLVASSDFDQTLREEAGVNRLRESVILFNDVWQSRFLQEAGVIVFLNKQDVLKEKIESGKSIGNYFPRYNEYEITDLDGDNDDEYIRTRCFIRDMFVELASNKEVRKSSLMPGLEYTIARQNRECYFHFTVATDTNNIRTVFEDVHTMILLSVLKDIGLE